MFLESGWMWRWTVCQHDWHRNRPFVRIRKRINSIRDCFSPTSFTKIAANFYLAFSLQSLFRALTHYEHILTHARTQSLSLSHSLSSSHKIGWEKNSWNLTRMPSRIRELIFFLSLFLSFRRWSLSGSGSDWSLESIMFYFLLLLLFLSTEFLFFHRTVIWRRKKIFCQSIGWFGFTTNER